MARSLISYERALRITLKSIMPLDSEMVPLLRAVGRVPVHNLFAKVDSPSADVSLKDGYAVRSVDIAQANESSPIKLKLIGRVAAGSKLKGEVKRGTAARILSGAPIPRGADAVISEEFTREEDGYVAVWNQAEPGRNRLLEGADVHIGQALVSAGLPLRPAQVGCIAAAGHDQVPVFRLPRVALLATGNEVIAPGRQLREGELYASNLVMCAAWCQVYGMATRIAVLRDHARTIASALCRVVDSCDAIITSGGAWKGEHDLVVRVLDELGWEKLYHRVKMGPGKAVGFGLWHGKPVFCLPGGPPSNQMAFLQLALPGLLRLAGYSQPRLSQLTATLVETVEGQEDWTQFISGCFERRGDDLEFRPNPSASRLSSMADAQGMVCIPEGTTTLRENASASSSTAVGRSASNSIKEIRKG